MTNLNTPELQGALDCLAMLLLQPEAENAVQAIPFAAEALLILGKDTLPQDSQEALTSIAEKPTVEPIELQKAYARLFRSPVTTTSRKTTSARCSVSRLSFF